MSAATAAPVVVEQKKKKEADVVNFQLFFGAQDVTLWSGLRRGYFDEYDIDVNYTYTSSGGEIRQNLADGNVDFVMGAADNWVYLSDRGAVILTGGDSSMNEFILQPQVDGLADMRNKNRTLVVDFPTTAYALQAYKVLDDVNVTRGEYRIAAKGATNRRYELMANESNRDLYDATVLSPPFSVLATRRDGLKSAGRVVDLIGEYQANSLASKKEWLSDDANADIATRFIAAYVKSYRWVLDGENADEVIDILVEELSIDDPSVARATYTLLTEPGFGLEPDMRFLWEGFDNVLRIREQFEGGGPFVVDELVDLRYYREALAMVDAEGEDDATNDTSTTASEADLGRRVLAALVPLVGLVASLWTGWGT